MPTPLDIILWIALAAITASIVISFFYMVRSRNPISTIIWLINPLNWVLGWWDVDLYDYNPAWLQVFRLVAIGTFSLAYMYKLFHTA